MYFAPTPFTLAEGIAHHRTLTLPERMPADGDLREIATLTRKETQQRVVAYNFDLITSELKTSLAPNPNAGDEYVFKAYRMEGDPLKPIGLVEHSRERTNPE